MRTFFTILILLVLSAASSFAAASAGAVLAVSSAATNALGSGVTITPAPTASNVGTNLHAGRVIATNDVLVAGTSVKDGAIIQSGTVVAARIDAAMATDAEVAAGYQPLDTDLTAFAGIAGEQGAILYHNGTAWVKLSPDTAGKFLETRGAGANVRWGTPAGSGDVVGPASSEDTQIALFDSTTGKLLKTSPVKIDSSGNITGVNELSMEILYTGFIVPTNAIGVAVGGTGLETVTADRLLSGNGTNALDLVTIGTGLSLSGTAGGARTLSADAATQDTVFVLTIEDVEDSMNYGIGFVGAAFTISEIRAVHVGSGLSSPSISLTVNHGTDRTSGTAAVTGGSTITSSTTGDSIESFDDATVSADSWLWITTASKSGTTDNLEVIVRGTYD